MMLAFSCFCDAHFHICDVYSVDMDFAAGINNFSLYMGCSSCASFEEFNQQKKIISSCNGEKVFVVSSYGVHPQNPLVENLSVLESLLEEDKIVAVGEFGIDLFNEDFKAFRDKQEIVWNYQLELAIKYNKPIIIHCRKGMEFIFKYCNKLKLLPSVLFHSFGGSFVEAMSILNKGVNAFFSFGKSISTFGCENQME